MPIAELNGNKLYYEDSGGDLPAIVFSHGGFLDHTMWEHQVAELSGEYRCITWDERGHGLSETGGPFDYWDAARDVVAILDACGVERAVCCGMSQGGWLSQRVALQSPDRCAGLVLCGTTMAPLSAEETAGYTQLSQGWMAVGPMGEIADAVYGIQFAGTEYDGTRYRDRWLGRPPGDWANAWDAILSRGDDVTPRAGEITCPVLFVHGDSDAAFPVSVAHEMSELVPDSRGVVVIEGGPHAAALTHPAEFNSAIRDFMQSL